MDDRHIATTLRRFFATSDEPLAAAYLFGSVARRSHGPASDIDVGLLYRETPPSRFGALPLRLEGTLERQLGRPVQVVVMNVAPVDLVHRILRDGHLVLDGDRPTRIRFEVKSRNEHLDLQPVLRRYRKQQPLPP